MRKHPDRHTYLTETPIPKLIPALAVPTIISMLVTGIYNSADTYFVGRISTQATAAVGLVFSVMAIIQAFGFFCGQGSGNYLSRLLGAGKKQEANEVAITGFLMALVIGLLIAALGNWQAERLADWIGATDTSRADTIAYMRIILMGAPFMTCQFVINNQLRFQGSAMYAMIGLMCGAVVNIILDPVLIFGFDLGIRGAALATVAGQAISFFALLIGSRKGENIRLVMRRNGFDHAVYIGDTVKDQEAAVLAGVPFIHAAYGFGQVSGADAVIHSLSELPEAIESIT